MPERAQRRHRWQNLAPAPIREGVRAVADTAEPELLIYDYIDSWGGEWGVSAAEVIAALDAIGDVPALTVRLSSSGGDYFEGVAIYNALVRNPANVTVCVDSLAASAASVIAMAGNRVIMGLGAQIMVHEARVGVLGATADDLRSTAVMVDQTNDDIAGFYAARTGGDVATWREAVRQETWYTAAQAVEAGLADEVVTPPTRAMPAPDEAPVAARADTPDAGRPAAPLAASCCTGPCSHMEDARSDADTSCAGPRPQAGAAPQQPTASGTPVPPVTAPETSAPEAEAPPAAEAPTAAVNLSELLCSAIREGVTP